MIRWVRQGNVPEARERWWLHGLVVVRTYPRPHRQYVEVLRLPAVRAALDLPAIPPRIFLLWPS